jgi:hypothetical protein
MRRRLFPVLFSAAGEAVTYLLRDDFITDDAAPLDSPRTCEPGPGTLTAAQNDGQFSISSGGLQVPVQTTPVFGDLGFYCNAAGGAAFTRAAGLALLHTINFATLTGGDSTILGWANATTLGAATFEAGALLNSTDFRPYSANATSAAALATGNVYAIAYVLRSAGHFLLVKGGAFASWTLVWVNAAGASASMYPGFLNQDNTGTFDNLRVSSLAAPWATDYGIATQQLSGARDPGDTFIHEGDCIIEFTVTTRPSADQIEVQFRKQDATNFWQVTIDSTGALDLDEVVAGTPTQRGTAAGVISNGERVVVLAVGTTIKVYDGNTIRITYASASNFQTETDGKLETEGTGGSVSNIVAWPRVLSGSALSTLTTITP